MAQFESVLVLHDTDLVGKMSSIAATHIRHCCGMDVNGLPPLSVLVQHLCHSLTNYKNLPRLARLVVQAIENLLRFALCKCSSNICFARFDKTLLADVIMQASPWISSRSCPWNCPKYNSIPRCKLKANRNYNMRGIATSVGRSHAGHPTHGLDAEVNIFQMLGKAKHCTW